MTAIIYGEPQGVASRRRGYPTLPDIDYDAQKRAALLDKLKCKCNFNRTKERTASPIMAMKVQFSPEVEQLCLPRRLKQLVAELRAEVGHEFLKGTRLVTAYTVQRSMFRQTYYMNFLPHTRCCLQGIGKRVEGFCV